MANILSSLLRATARGIGKGSIAAARYGAGLGKEGAYALWDRKNLSGKVLRGAIGFGGYYGAGQLSASLIENLKENTRVRYGLTQDETSMFNNASSLLRTAGMLEGTASIFGFSHLQRLRYFGKDISNLVPGGKLYAKRNTFSKLTPAQRSETFALAPGAPKPKLFQKPNYKYARPEISGFKSMARLSATAGQVGFGALLGQASEILPSSEALTNISLTATTLPAAVLGIAAARLGMNVFSEGMGRPGLRGLTTAMGVSIGGLSMAGGAVVGMRSNMYPAAEGNIQEIGRESVTNRMNFSTAGLSLALHRLK